MSQSGLSHMHQRTARFVRLRPEYFTHFSSVLNTCPNRRDLSPVASTFVPWCNIRFIRRTLLIARLGETVFGLTHGPPVSGYGRGQRSDTSQLQGYKNVQP